jgi:hypothetical protein
VNRRLLPFVPGLIVIALCVAGLYAIYAHDKDRCEAKGGHLVAVYKSWICVSADGRVLE